MEPADVIGSISKQNIRWVRLQFLDIDGKLREISVSSSKIFSSTFEEGFYSDEISNLFLGDEKEDLVLKPIPDSFAIIPWEDSSARLLCKIEKNGKDYSRDSISMLGKVKNLYSLAGYDEISIQATQEFSIFETVVVDKTSPQRGPSVNLDTREAPWNSNPLAYDNKWQAMTMPQDVYSLIRIQILDSLLSFFRISAQAHIHSKGVAKQGLLFDEMMLQDAASSLISSKYVAKNISLLNGAMATFMAYPMYHHEPNRTIFKIKLRKKGKNVFYSPDGDKNLSKVALSFMSGIINHAPALSLFTNPTTNSYKAIVTFPMHNAWSSTLNSALINVRQSPSDRDDVFVEVRLSDSSINPYLALSAILLAGLDGIKSKSSSFEELEEDPSLLSEKKKSSKLGNSLPFSLYDSIIEFEKDSSYTKGVFSPEFISDYIALKLAEYKEEISRPSGFDYKEYFNV